jgi:omega-6 fatty acid desaturase (delta-12 desaturase)
MCFLSLVRNPKKHWDSAIALVFHCLIGGLFFKAGGWNAFLFAFFLPALISSSIGTYLFYVQHNFCGATFEPKESWTKVKASIQSTSFLQMSPAMNWFTGNIGYHHVHHLNSMIPFYNLPEAHKAFIKIQDVQTTSFHPSEMLKCLRLKLCNDENGILCELKQAKS